MLYAEDEPDDVFFLREAWETVGVPNPLIAVKDGQEAIDYLAGNGPYADRKQYPFPCLLLLDINLPVKSGFDVLRWINQNLSRERLKVVILTGSNQETDIQMARELGVTEYIVKPSNPMRLSKIVEEEKDRWFASKKQTRKCS